MTVTLSLNAGTVHGAWMQAPLDLWVNEVDRGVQTVWMNEAGGVCLPRELLQRLGIRPWRAPVAERDCLEPGARDRVRFHLLVRRAELRLEVDPRLLEPTRRGREPLRRAPAPWVDSAFLNYALERRETEDGVHALAPLEAVVNSHGWTLEGRFTLVDGPDSPWRLLALDGRLIRDLPDRRERWELGRVLTPGDGLIAARPLIGVGFARHAEMDPGLLRYDGFTVSGLAHTPSTVEVWLDGRLLTRESVPPGPFQLRDLPAGGGRRSGRVVIRDAFGRERIQTLDLYTPLRPLTRLERDHALYLGRVEGDGPLFGYGRYRRALSRGRQVGFWAAFEERHVLVGWETLWVPARRGEVGLRLGRSRHGAAGVLDYAYAGRRWRIALALSLRETGYWDGAVVTDARTRRTRFSLGLSAGFLGNWSLSWQARDSGGRQETGVSLAQRRRLWRGAAYTLRLQRGFDETGLQGVFTFTWWLGRGRALGVSGLPTVGGMERRFWLQQSRRPALATDWRVGLGADPGGQRFDGRLGWNLQHLRLEGASQYRNGEGAIRLGLAGSLVFADERWYLARPVREAFAVVETPGFDGVPVYLRRGYQGRTRKGRLLVPDLGAYTGNVLRLGEDGLPVNVIPQQTRTVLFPRYRQGVVARFSVRRIRAVSGTLVDGQGHPLAFDRLFLETDDGPRMGVVGRAGLFYLEDLPAGEYPGRLKAHGCHFLLHVPASDDVVVETGQVVCR